MNKVIFSTFYTKDTVYENVYKQYFQTSLMKWGYMCSVLPVDKIGDWYANVAQKPKIIKHLLKQIHEDGFDTLVFLDADSVIMREPSLFFSLDKSFDIGYHVLEWDKWYNRPGDTTKELLTGTMVFRYNDRVLGLLDEWYQRAVETKVWEQKVLQQCIGYHDLKKVILPLEYCFINSLPNGKQPHVSCDPVIAHYQVSRYAKRMM